MTDKNDTQQDTEQESDVVIEETDEEGNPGDVVRKLREKLATAVAEKQSYLDGWQRTQADFVNYKKRELEERENLIKYANEPLISDIIPALDNFDIAMGNKEAWEKADKNWRIGIEYIYSELVKTLERYGVKQVNPIGEVFSAALHEPTEAVITENEAEDGKIVAVLQKGYTLNNKNIRPAKVKVGELKSN
jgi:molecular chaperone GrpE